MLRDLASQVRREQDGDDFGQSEYQDIADAVFLMQSLHDQLDPMYFMKAVKDMKGKAAKSAMDAVSRSRNGSC